MKAYLIQIDARDSTGDALTMRFASHDDAGLCHHEGQIWWPAIAKLPSLGYDFFDGGFRGDISNPSGSFSLSMQALPDMASAIWSDAAITIYQMSFDDSVIANLATLFVGRIRSQPRFFEGVVDVEFESDSRWLDEPLLDTYAGTGGIEGPDELEGAIKPLLLGAPRFAPGVLIDAVDNVYQLSAYGAIQGVEAVYDRLSSLGASVGDHADLATLLAADIANGSWGTCNALGLVRLGAPPDGQVCFHVNGGNVGGWLRLPGNITTRIAAIAGGKVSSASLFAINISRPWNLSLAITEQVTARELIQSIAASIKAVAGIDWVGQLFMAPIGITGAVKTLNSDGSALPMIAEVSQFPVDPPFWRLATEAEKTWVVHGDADIAYQFNFRGAYAVPRVYRQDDVVSTDDGSTWRFVGSAPLAGSVPSDENVNWERRSGPTSLSAIGGNRITHASPTIPGFPEFAIDGTGDRHVDLEGRRYVQLSYDDAQLVIDGIPITIDGQPVYMGWRRIDPVVKIGGVGGLIVQNSSGDNQVDSDLLNNLRRQVVATAEIQLQADTEGALQSTIPFDIQVKALIGNDDVSAETSFAATFPPGITGTINNDSGDADRGDINISALVSGGNIVVTATFADGLKESVQIRVTVVTGQQPITGGIGATMIEDRTWLNISSTDFVQITDQPLVLNSDGSGDLRFSFSASFEGVAGLNVEVVARYRTEGSGGAWSDAGTSAVGSATAYEPEFGITLPGYISKAQFTQAMGANDSPYEVALFGKRIAGSGSAAFSNSNSLFLVKQ